MSNQQLSALQRQCIAFIQSTFRAQRVERAVIAVSGGIDSAVSLTLLTQALGPAAVTPVLLPYGEQDMGDAQAACDYNQVGADQQVNINIKPIVDQIAMTRNVAQGDQLRRGNIMARTRMILLFDIAREQSALVCGTENKSEHYLGYFTRFGDAASDLEPIASFYKTQVRELAAYLGLPVQIIIKAPSAGLWDAQTDEAELGFTYEQADQVLSVLIDQGLPPEKISLPDVHSSIVQAVCQRVADQSFKRAVPYTMVE